MHQLGVALFLIAISYLRVSDGCTGQKLPSRNEGNVIQRLVGNDIQESEYAGSGQGPVYSGDELRCTFDQSCCWRGGSGDIVWMKASGNPEPEKMQSSFGTSDAPNGDYLVASSEGSRSDQQKAQFISCRISCAASDITLRARHWNTKGMTIRACTLDGDSTTPNCRPWGGSNGSPDTVVLPGGKNIQLVIEAAGFTATRGSVAMLDDLSVDYQTCNAISTPSPITQQPTAPLNNVCNKIVCSFEQNNPCSYSDARSAGLDTGGVSVPWRVVGAPFENRLTGIARAGEGDHFAAAYLKPGDKAVLVTDVNYPTDYIVRLNGYRATEGINLFGCCNDMVVCPFSTTEQVQVSDYRVWKTASIICPTGTKKIIFFAMNSGRNQGAVGLDNIQLLVPSTTPEQASQSAC